jgi:hypothetical protein
LERKEKNEMLCENEKLMIRMYERRRMEYDDNEREILMEELL